MDYALSLKDGCEYLANKITIGKAKALKLVCPVCNEKVFKKRRTVPEVTDFFCHHKGLGTPECELYHPPTQFGGTGKSDGTPPQGQDFRAFVSAVSGDIFQLLIQSAAVQQPIDENLLTRIANLLDKYEFEEDRDSLQDVERDAQQVLEALGLLNYKNVARILSAISSYFQRPSARFIDVEVCTWTIYSLCGRHYSNSIRPSTALRVLISDANSFDKISSLFIAGLASQYAKRDTNWFKDKFSAACRKVKKQIQRVEQKKIEVKTRPVIVTEATPLSIDRESIHQNVEELSDRDSIHQFAIELGVAADVLIGQLNAAGIANVGPSDVITESHKTKLLEYLRRIHKG